jgi:SAM-dependent methyltransferase
MPNFNTTPSKIIKKHKEIFCFDLANQNIDLKVVDSFGEEWQKFYNFSDSEIEKIGNEYFSFLPEGILSRDTDVLDVGCGTGRWAKYLSDKVHSVEAIDPSKAIFYADELLKNISNVRLSIASTDTIPFADESFDFVMSVGVLHHIPDTVLAMKDCVKKVKKGGWFYVYLYYALDNRGWLFKTIFSLVNGMRLVIARQPSTLKKIICDFLALTVYMPLVLFGRLVKYLGMSKIAEKIPLSYYQNKTFFIIRNDALDRFGTRLEQRFSKTEVEEMMKKAGLTNIVISPNTPFWCAAGQKK